MNASDVERWVDGYVHAWQSNDPAAIGRLFTDDALYFTAPDRDPWRGRDGIVAGWLERKDEPGQWGFRHEVLAVAGDLGFVRGWTTYANPPTEYSNLWVIRLTPAGQCAEFTEWWMEHD
jgi:ketosteroid isomerase-like protein